MINVYILAFRIAEIVDKLRTSTKERCRTNMPTRQFKKSFRTVALDFGRCSGKDTFANYMVAGKKKAIVVTKTIAMARDQEKVFSRNYHRDRNPTHEPFITSLDHYITYAQYNPDNSFHNVDYVIVNEPWMLNQAEIDSIYDIFGHQGTKYIFIGSFMR